MSEMFSLSNSAEATAFKTRLHLSVVLLQIGVPNTVCLLKPFQVHTQPHIKGLL